MSVKGKRRKGGPERRLGLVPFLTCEGCGKRNFASKKEAKRALGRTQSQPGQYVRSIYRCLDGGDWHLTSQDEERTRWYRQNS